LGKKRKGEKRGVNKENDSVGQEKGDGGKRKKRRKGGGGKGKRKGKEKSTPRKKKAVGH